MSTESPKDAIKAAFFDRLSHPVMGVFLLALVVSNWRSLVYIVVSDANAEYRITQAAGYANAWTLFTVPAAVTLVYVLLAPVFKVLALMWDRAVTNWENVRAHQAKINVIVRSTVAVEAKLTEIENQLVVKKTENENLKIEIDMTRKEIERLQNAIHDFSAFLTPAWRNLFPNMNFPLSKDKSPGNYQVVQSVFERIEALRQKVLIAPPPYKT